MRYQLVAVELNLDKRDTMMKRGKRHIAKKKRSNKGALIKGMSRRLPVELLGEISFRDALHQIMRGYAGVYALYKRDRLYYIGLANNLYWRLLGHTKN